MEDGKWSDGHIGDGFGGGGVTQSPEEWDHAGRGEITKTGWRARCAARYSTDMRNWVRSATRLEAGHSVGSESLLIEQKLTGRSRQHRGRVYLPLLVTGKKTKINIPARC